MPWNIPNTLTYIRLMMIPVFVTFFYLPDDWMQRPSINLLAALVFAGAAITDWFDGYLARRLNQASAFGAFLDPVADKLMVVAALIVLVELNRVHALIALIIIGREIAISALREWMAEVGDRKSVAVSMVGKVKTAVQMIAISLLLYHGSILGGPTGYFIGTLLIYVAAFLTLWSMIYYLRMALPSLIARK